VRVHLAAEGFDVEGFPRHSAFILVQRGARRFGAAVAEPPYKGRGGRLLPRPSHGRQSERPRPDSVSAPC
jgi:hypothetical protein